MKALSSRTRGERNPRDITKARALAPPTRGHSSAHLPVRAATALSCTSRAATSGWRPDYFTTSMLPMGIRRLVQRKCASWDQVETADMPYFDEALRLDRPRLQRECDACGDEREDRPPRPDSLADYAAGKVMRMVAPERIHPTNCPSQYTEGESNKNKNKAIGPGVSVRDAATLAMEPSIRVADRDRESLRSTGTNRLQTQLTIGASNDPLEQEADRVADQIMAAPAHSSLCATPPHIQRYTGRATKGLARAPASVGRVLASSGKALEPALRRNMERRFGYDFSEVRVHSGSVAEQSARDVHANAYTAGQNIVFGAGRFAPGTNDGQRLIAHELTHLVQQSNVERIYAVPGNAVGAADIPEQRTAASSVVAGLLQRQEIVAPPEPAASRGDPVGDAVQPVVESLVKAFSFGIGYEAKNAAAVDAVKEIVRAYSMSTKGLRTMRYNPDLPSDTYARTLEYDDNSRECIVEFGRGSFSNGFAHLVHVVAHELEHVRQALIGGIYTTGMSPVKEFLAYTSSVLQVQSVSGAAGRGFLGAQITGDAQRAPALPPLPPDILESVAMNALGMFYAMPSAEQKKPRYRQELAAAGNKLFARLKSEAPPQLRPPAKYTVEWSRWYEGVAPTLDVFTPEYQDWQDALDSPWSRVKSVWKRFDAAFRVH